MDFKHIIFTKDQGIARITINRPEVRNALNIPARQEIRSAIDDIKGDKTLRVAVITGAGDKAFIAGADISFWKNASPFDVDNLTGTLGQQLYLDIESLDIPVIAQINGYCLGGGCEIAMSCDIRIASENARFGQPEINIGIIPGGGGTQRLPRIIGPGRAKELIFTGKMIDASEALVIGLVDRVVPVGELAGTVNKLCEEIAAKSPIILKIAKRAINKGLYSDLASGLAYERNSLALCFATRDTREGVSAFLEKRKPIFTGQ